MTDAALIVAVLALPLGTAVLMTLMPSAAAADRLNLASSALTATLALILATVALAATPDVASRGGWYVLDAASGLFLALVAVVGFASAAMSPIYLRHAGRSWFTARRSHVWYYAAFNVFWASLLALPLADNLAVAWLLIEATTAASALLVAFSGKRSALEAGWKYVVLTTLGLGVALLGIVVLFVAVGSAGSGLSRLDWQALAEQASALPPEATLVAFVLILVGLASKIGWAPVHNWLPDAHSEAPPPVSALLSAALLPTVLLIAWRAKLALEPALGKETMQELFIGFGLLSLLVAIPFLWGSLPWKRLLAYSSLEHMGVLALGIGFGTPLAIAGVVIHVAGHGIAKALGFYTAIPLLREQPRAANAAARGVARTSPAIAGAMSVSLISLSGLPPSPLFVSEVMILLGGIDAGLIAASAVAAILLALGFLGLAHALLEGLLGDKERGRPRPSRSVQLIALLACTAAVVLLGLTVAAYALPDSDLVKALMRSGA